MPKKTLLNLKETRVNRMIEEQQNLERERKEQERQALKTKFYRNNRLDIIIHIEERCG